jgi:hypothetical protein
VNLSKLFVHESYVSHTEALAWPLGATVEALQLLSTMIEVGMLLLAAFTG